MHESDDRADDARGDGTGAESAEDAAWREIVANYGERAQLEDDLDPPGTEPATYVVGGGRDDTDGSDGSHDDSDDRPIFLEDVEGYDPPPPPPLPRPTPERLMAWVGLLGSPVAAVVLVIVHSVTGYVFPTWVTALLVVAFLGGFGYLLVTMARDPDDPWDDGARV